MSISTQINRLKQAKQSIKTAIENKGVPVDTSALLDEYASFISRISGGGSGYSSELVDNPEYFYSECIDTAQKINALRTSNTFVMYFITDSHVYTSSNNMQYLDAQLASMYAVAKTIKPNLVVHGGDMTNGSEAKNITLGYTSHIVNCMREIGGNDTLILIGNHDGNTVQSSLNNENERITEAEMLELYRSWNDGFTYANGGREGGGFYGYKDYPGFNLRVIRLHSYREKIGTDGYYGGQGQNWGYYDDEVTWFRNVALNTDYAILVICHQTLSPVLQGYSESAEIPHNGMQMQTAIDNWLAANANHKCVGVIHGHVHWDYAAKGNGTFTVIDHSTKNRISRTGTHGNFYEYAQGFSNYMTSFPASDSTPTSSYRDVPVDAIVPGRSAGKTSQGLWTAVLVDTDKNTINFVRFGAGNDMAFNYGGGTYYSISNNLTGATSNNPSTLVDYGASYTAVITADSGYTINDYSVLMGGVNITSTAYSNGRISIPSVTGNVVITVVASKPRTNVLPTAVDANGNPYNNGKGYKAGYRLNSLGNEAANASTSVTGFIPMTMGQTMILSGIELPATNYTGYDACYISVYDSEKVCLKSNYSKDWHNSSLNPSTKDSDNHLVSIRINEGINHEDLSEMAYVRFSALAINDSSAVYIE